MPIRRPIRPRAPRRPILPDDVRNALARHDALQEARAEILAHEVGADELLGEAFYYLRRGNEEEDLALVNLAHLALHRHLAGIVDDITDLGPEPAEE